MSVLELVKEILSPASLISSVGNVIASPFVVIWNWILYNLLSPIIIVVYIVLFLIGQYYLIKFYVYVIKNIIGSVVKFGMWISKNEKLIKGIEKFFNDTSSNK